jgi:hypothetical protein
LTHPSAEADHASLVDFVYPAEDIHDHHALTVHPDMSASAAGRHIHSVHHVPRMADISVEEGILEPCPTFASSSSAIDLNNVVEEDTNRCSSFGNVQGLEHLQRCLRMRHRAAGLHRLGHYGDSHDYPVGGRNQPLWRRSDSMTLWIVRI